MNFENNGSTTNVISGNFGFHPQVTQTVEEAATMPRQIEHTPTMVVSKDKHDTLFAKEKEVVEQPMYDGNVSDFFSNRKAIWAGQGEKVDGCMSVEEVFAQVPRLASPINKEPIFDQNGKQIPNFFATIRECDRRSLGIVGARYKILQNVDAFSMLDELIGEGMRFQNIGTWKDDSRVWILGKLPQDYQIDGDKVNSFILFKNSFDGSGAIQIAITPVRVVCQNMINLALKSASRSWSARHTSSVDRKLDEARETLNLSEIYMKRLQEEFDRLSMIKMDKDKVIKFTNQIAPVIEGRSERQNRNAKQIQADILRIYSSAPDLKDRDETAARFLQAVADADDHRTPARKTKDYAANRFEKLVDGNGSMLDKAYDLVLSA